MKKYIITGSLGHISKPIVEGLVKAGKEVYVITSNQSKVDAIEELGAKALVGNVQDAAFLKNTFRTADVIYTMIPPIWETNNWRASQNEIARNYAEALKASEVKYVVNLSSIGAHLQKDCGPVNGLYDFEQLLNKVPGLNVKHLRPSFFYYNFFSQIALVKQAGIIGGNYGDGEKLFLVHTDDIAAAALDELLNLRFSGSSIRYILGDERSGNEIAEVLGKSIGRPLKWVVFTDEQQKQGLLQAGLPETHAQNFTEMGKAIREGRMQEDAKKNRPQLSSRKLEDFAKEFAVVFQTQN